MITTINTKRTEVRSLTDEALGICLHKLVGQERHIEVLFVIHLEEFDRRRLYEARHRSLWDYCCNELRLLEGAASRRITTARLLRKFPQTLPYLCDGSLRVTTLAMLDKHLTRENVDTLLAQAADKSTRQVEKLVATLKAPVVEVEVVRKIDPKVVAVTPSITDLFSNPPITSSSAAAPIPTSAPPPLDVPAPPVATLPPPRNLSSLFAVVTPEDREKIRAVSAEQFEFRFTADRELFDLYEEMKDLAANRGMADLMKRGLLALREKVGKRNGTIPVRETATRKPTDKAKEARPHMPRALYRFVFKRDGGCCSYVMKGGQRCNSKRHRELDHIVPVARGGKTEAGNLRLVCHLHNQRLADEAFGEAFMKKFR